MGKPWLYYGLLEDAHNTRDLTRKFYQAVTPGLLIPYLEKDYTHSLLAFDGLFPPDSLTGYQATYSVLGSLNVCILAWWDYTIDTRPGSSVMIIAPRAEVEHPLAKINLRATDMLSKAESIFLEVFDRYQRHGKKVTCLTF